MLMSFGEEIRRERELRQISLREVAQATKINLRYLEAMERNDFAYLPGGLFNRGFVRAYCQHIGVDSESMVNAYLLEEQSQAGTAKDPEAGLLRGSAVGGPTRDRSTDVAATSHRRPKRARLIRWGLVVLVSGLIVAGLYLTFRLVRTEDRVDGSATPGAEQSASAAVRHPADRLQGTGEAS